MPLNTDGLDLWGTNILVENVKIRNYDDAVVPKPRGEGACTQDIIVRNASVTYGVGMSIGSVPPDTGCNCVRRVTFEDIDFTYPLKAIYIKTNPGDEGSGLIEDIVYDRISMYNPIWWAVYIGPQ